MENTEARQIAATTRQQIGVMILMSVGAHKFSFDAAGSLAFKVGGRQRFMRVELSADDTYRIVYERIKRNHGVEVLADVSGVYCDCLGATVRSVYDGNTHD